MNDLTSIKSAHPHTLNIIPEPVLKKKKKRKTAMMPQERQSPCGSGDNVFGSKASSLIPAQAPGTACTNLCLFWMDQQTWGLGPKFQCMAQDVL